MPSPLSTAVRVAQSVNKITSALGASIFAVVGMWQLWQQIKRQREKDQRWR